MKLEAGNNGRIIRLVKKIALVEILKEQGVNNELEDIERSKVDWHTTRWRWFIRWKIIFFNQEEYINRDYDK